MSNRDASPYKDLKGIGPGIPVIDLFAGPGGLGEGFSCLRKRGRNLFRICLSIEKDTAAYKTLLLRSFFRQFRRVPEAYYHYVRGRIEAEKLFKRFPEEYKRAKAEALRAELGKVAQTRVNKLIRSALANAKEWLLIGGPPCQAYSIVGRSRLAKLRAHNLKKFEGDRKHRLYRQYLKILAKHRPVVFIMENVKGILSSQLSGKRIFNRILQDLECPSGAFKKRKKGKPRRQKPEYKLYSLVSKVPKTEDPRHSDPKRFIVKSEKYGVPQARHRVILLGIRANLNAEPKTLPKRKSINLRDVIESLPRIRSGLSRQKDSDAGWTEAVRSIQKRPWFRSAGKNTPISVLKWRMRSAMKRMRIPRYGKGKRFIACQPDVAAHRNWFIDPRLKGVCQHEARNHMKRDLYRYLFAACFASMRRKSPKLSEFPKPLLPKHENAKKGIEEVVFDDRFRVQVWDKPSSTVVSHIQKDGHYFIHPDASQCRSLTPREVARLQTFPDNYFFEGTRTKQYEQIGNAVPPFLAKQIASIVFDLLCRARSGKS